MWIRISGGREENGDCRWEVQLSRGRKVLVRCLEAHWAGTTDKERLSLSKPCLCLRSSPSSSSDRDVVDGA